MSNENSASRKYDRSCINSADYDRSCLGAKVISSSDAIRTQSQESNVAVTPRVTDSDTGNRCSHTACASPHRRPTPHTTCEACLHRPTPQPLMEGTEGAGASDMWGWGLPPEQPLGEGPSDVVWQAHSSTTRGGAGASSIWSQPDIPLGEGSSDVAWPAYSSTTRGLGTPMVLISDCTLIWC